MYLFKDQFFKYISLKSKNKFKLVSYYFFQGNMNKLIHFLQQGRLVNIHSFSVNTIASVLKQFLRKIPGGIFGRENEAILFTLVNLETEEEKLALAQR